MRSRLQDLAATYWSEITRLGNNRVLKTSYFWLIFVPIVARTLEWLGKDAAMTLFGKKLIILQLSLPFSWKIFFYAALFFSIAGIIYSFRCPNLVRLYAQYSDFEKTGKGYRQLIRDFLRVAYMDKPDERDKQIVAFINTYSTDLTLDEEAPIELQSIIDATIPRTNMPDAFWHARDLGNTVLPYSRLVCLIFYTIGFFLIGVVFIQNILYVIKWTF